LNRVKNRLGTVVCQWHHWLPTLGYVSVLAIMVIVFGESYPVFRQSASIEPLSSVSASVRTSSAEGCSGSDQLPAGSLTPIAAEESAVPPLPIDKETVALLQEAKRWDMESLASLPQMSTAARLPEGIGELEGENRKKFFIDTILPNVMVAIHEVRQERQQLLAIISELGLPATELSFAEDELHWQHRLGADKTQFILALTRKYRTTSAEELVAMVDVLPPSLIIAQGALESAWGASHIANVDNNLFGMYTSENDTLADDQNAGKEPKIMEYDSILDSVRAYVLNINRLPAYKELRRIRSQTLDPMLIAEGLIQYSERKEHYIKDVKRIIAMNKLQDYDTAILAAG
jgi:Bax protein